MTTADRWLTRGAASTPTTCDALLAPGGAADGTRVAAAVVSSALARSALICLLPGARRGQAYHLNQTTAACPCCWRVESLQAALAHAGGGAGGGGGGGGAAADAAAAKAEAKALGKARKYAGCRIWRRYA